MSLADGSPSAVPTRTYSAIYVRVGPVCVSHGPVSPLTFVSSSSAVQSRSSSKLIDPTRVYPRRYLASSIPTSRIGIIPCGDE